MHLDDNKIKKFIEEAARGFHTKNDVIEMLEQVQVIVDELNEEVACVEDALQQMEIRGECKNSDPMIIRQMIKGYGLRSEQYDELDKTKAARQQAAMYLADLQKIRDSYKNFNKAICFSNIRALLRTSDVKIGQIEREAGVRLGYMARLEKPDNTSEPSIEFILTAAKMLGVTFDFLVSANVDEVTPTEEYVLNFIKRIVKDTKEGNLQWVREAASELNGVFDDYGSYAGPHPLFVYDTDNLDGNGNPHVSRFCSRFFRECSVDVMGNSYHAQLPRTSTTLYVLPCTIYKDEDCVDGESCFEVYMYDGDEVNAVCSSLCSSNTVGVALKDLYDQIQAASSHIQINQKTRNVINAYLGIGGLDKIMQVPPIDTDDLPFT